MILAKRSVDQVTDPALKELLSSPVNAPYLEAGAIGPDVFYFGALGSTARTAHVRIGYKYYGDLGHYCRSSDLARAMIDLAQTPQEKAW